MGKMWYESRTMWVNMLVGAFMVVLPWMGVDVTPEIAYEYAVPMLVVVNMVLRSVTDKPVNLS